MARLLNGVMDYLQVDQAPVTAAPFYVSIWFRRNTNVNKMTLFTLIDTSDGLNNRFQLRVDTDATPGLRWRVRDSTGGASAVTSIATTIDTWHHGLAVEAGIADHRVYLDGGNKGTSPSSRTPTGIDRTTVGRNRPSQPDNWPGDLGQLAIYGGVPTDDDALTLASGISPLRFNRDNLKAYWPLGGQDGEPDVIGGLTLTIFGVATNLGLRSDVDKGETSPDKDLRLRSDIDKGEQTPPQSEEPPIPWSIVAPG